MKTVNFKLKDADGLEHEYEVVLFSVAENVKLQLMVAGPLMEAAGRALATVLPAITGKKIGDVLKDMSTLVAALRLVDWTSAPAALTVIPEMIEARGGATLITKIFNSTTRLTAIPELQNIATASGDGELDSDLRQPLADPVHQDAAFGDGNFRDYWTAAAMVLIVNFTRHGRNGSGSLKGLVGTLTGGLVTPSTPTTGTTPPSSGSAKGSQSPPH